MGKPIGVIFGPWLLTYFLAGRAGKPLNLIIFPSLFLSTMGEVTPNTIKMHSGKDRAQSDKQVSTAKPRKALLNQFITLSAAQAEEEDMRAELQYAEKRGDFYDNFYRRREEIQQLVAFHCGVANPASVQVPEKFDGMKLVWLHGSFNMCIPICINSGGRTLPSNKLGFRVPLPYKLGEEAFPGNAEEKVRSEAATYSWISKNCPDVSIPALRGFGLPGGLSVSL